MVRVARGASSDGGGGCVPDGPRLERLTRGVNLSHWFAQGPISPAHFRTFVGAEDARRLKALGFRHVRLNVNPDILLDRTDPDVLNEAHLPVLDDAVDLLLAHDLAVIVELHPEEAFKRRLRRQPGFVPVLAEFWRALARHFSTRHPSMLFLEVLNEPNVGEPERWARIQQELLFAMREGAPNHTLIATGGGWGAVDHLLALTPVVDRNVVYSFHLYEPALFTHQGADWGRAAWRYVRALPYPSSPEAVAGVLRGIRNARARAAARAYREERWDVGRLRAAVDRAAHWGRRHHVRLICTEFRVYRPVAPPGDRNAWIRDARTLLERSGIGWTVWDYAGGFGVVVEQDGRPVTDTSTILALGLHDRPEQTGTPAP